MDDLSLLKPGLEGTMKTLLSQNQINRPPYMQINNYNHIFKKKQSLHGHDGIKLEI